MNAVQDWKLASTRDTATVTPEWDEVNAPLIDGLSVREVRNVLTHNGVLTEIFRDNWTFAATAVSQVFARQMDPGAISAWHCHGVTTDHLSCVAGRMRLVFFDAREDSPTRGVVRVVIAGSERPKTIEVPPGVWHGVQNLGAAPSLLINCVDQSYDYGAPDHWRLPLDTPEIPYRFT